MKIRLVLGVAIMFLHPTLACDSSETYSVRFVCGSTGGTACPPGTECPELPLGSDSCGDLPGLLGNPATRVMTGRPLGCSVGLAYADPSGNNQQTCTCSTLGSSTSPSTAQWLCPI